MMNKRFEMTGRTYYSLFEKLGLRTIHLIGILAPTGFAAIFEILYFTTAGTPISWEDVIFRTAAMLCASLLFSGFVFHLIQDKQQAIQKERDRFFSLFSQSTDGMVLLDEQHTILESNPTAKEMLLGHYSEGKNMLATATEIPREIEIVGADGRSRLLLVTASDLEAGDETPYPSKLVILRDISAQRAEDEAKLARLTTMRAIQAQEEERQRLARELHDGVAQDIYACRLGLRMVASKPAQVEEIDRQLSGILDEVNRLAVSLWPTTIDKLGIIPALRALCRNLQTSSGIEVDFQTTITKTPSDRRIQAVLYRLCQEALSNAIKHSGTSRIAVSLDEDAEQLSLTIQDWGRGFSLLETREKYQGLGLFSMEERVVGVNGRITWDTGPGKGTFITVTLPLREDDANERNALDTHSHRG